MSDGAVGIVGVGKIGRAVASVIAATGVPLTLYNRTRSAAEDAAAETGAAIASTPKELAEQCDIVISCLGDPVAVSDCYFGQHGLLAGARSTSTFVELATLAPANVRSLASAVESTGSEFLYSSVTGRPIELARGAGYVMTSGARTAAARVDPLLTALGRVRYLGEDATNAAVMKLAVNLCVFSVIGSTAEALALATQSGLDAQDAFDILLESPVGSPFLRLRRDAFLHPEGTPPVTAQMRAAVKNYELIVQHAEETHTVVDQAAVTKSIMEAACEAGYGERDGTSLVHFVRRISDQRRSARTAGDAPHE